MFIQSIGLDPVVECIILIPLYITWCNKNYIILYIILISYYTLLYSFICQRYNCISISLLTKTLMTCTLGVCSHFQASLGIFTYNSFDFDWSHHSASCSGPWKDQRSSVCTTTLCMQIEERYSLRSIMRQNIADPCMIYKPHVIV